MITDRNLKPGTRLTATYKGLKRFATVLEDGTIHLADADQDDLDIGYTYNSLSKAAMAITGNSVNGWRFWTVEESLADRLGAHQDKLAAAAAAKPEPKRKAPTSRQLARTVDAAAQDADAAEERRNLAGDDASLARQLEKPAEREAQARITRRGRKPIHLISFLKGDHTKYWCTACQQGYPIEVGALLPAVCPAGHRDDNPELTSPDLIREWSAEEKMSALASAEGEFNIDNMTPHSESSRYYDDPATDR